MSFWYSATFIKIVVIDFLENTWPGFAFTFELILPALLLLLAVLKKPANRGG